VSKRAARRRPSRVAAIPAASPALRAAMTISPEASARARAPMRALDAETIFAPYKPAPGVVPEGAGLAMDSISGYSNQTVYAGSGAWEEGQQFIGYPILSILAQRSEYRVIAETFAVEMTRKWVEFYSDAAGKEDTIAKIEDELERLNAQAVFREAIEHDGLFGRGQIFIDYGDRDQAELRTDIGNGQNETSREKCTNRRIRRLKTIEAVWTYPASYNASDPLADGWYKPTAWFVMGREIHASRLLTLIGREVPDILKPAYAFGGLSLTQMCKPYVDAWIETSRGVTDIVTSFSTFVLKTNMTAILSGGNGDSLSSRLDIFAGLRTNRKVMAIDKEMEEFINVSAPLGTLDRLVGQKQEAICSAAKLPLIKFTGISPSGLNASSEGELQSWDDNVLSAQEAMIRPTLTPLVDLVQLSLFGAVDKSIRFRFAPLREITPEEQSEMASKVTAAVVAAFADGLIDKATAMEELKKSSDKTGLFASIPQEDIDEERANPSPAPGEGALPDVPKPEGLPGLTHKAIGEGATVDPWVAALGGKAKGEDGGPTGEQWAAALAADELDAPAP
jgi:phage-related protein (TIGR01555 family)